MPELLPFYDITQMHQSGYGPSTIEEAEAYNAQWARLLASPIGPYLRDGTPAEVELASGIRLLPLAAIAEGTREFAPDKILFNEGYAPIASGIGGGCLSYDTRTEAFYWADPTCVGGTEYLSTPGYYVEMPYSAENLRKALTLVSKDPPAHFIGDLRRGLYQETMDDLD